MFDPAQNNYKRKKVIEIIKIFILPLSGFILTISQLIKLKNGVDKINSFYLVVGLIVLGVSIYNEADNSSDKKKLKESIVILQDSVTKISDTLISVKDTLVNIGLSIDEKTGRLLVMDSQLLKKEFIQVFNYNNTPISSEIPDSDNYTVIRRKDSLFLYPRKGTWVHGYFAHDTTDSKTFIAHLSEGMGTPDLFDPISVNGKTYNTHIWKMYNRAVYADKPIALKLIGYADKYIIFGDEGIPSKRWIYESGKVRWIPE